MGPALSNGRDVSATVAAFTEYQLAAHSKNQFIVQMSVRRQELRSAVKLATRALEGEQGRPRLACKRPWHGGPVVEYETPLCHSEHQLVSMLQAADVLRDNSYTSHRVGETCHPLPSSVTSSPLQR